MSLFDMRLRAAIRRCPNAARHIMGEGRTNANLRRNGFTRAGGDVLCPDCGHKFYDHPPDPGEQSLTVLCDGRRVKL